jgi:hypothetical protein
MHIRLLVQARLIQGGEQLSAPNLHPYEKNSILYGNISCAWSLGIYSSPNSNYNHHNKDELFADD